MHITNAFEQLNIATKKITTTKAYTTTLEAADIIFKASALELENIVVVAATNHRKLSPQKKGSQNNMIHSHKYEFSFKNFCLKHFWLFSFLFTAKLCSKTNKTNKMILLIFHTEFVKDNILKFFLKEQYFIR